MVSDIRPLLAQKICWFRERAGLTQRALAHALKVDKATIFRAEQGKSWPDYNTLEAIANELKVDIAEFFSWGERTKSTLIEALEIIREDLNAPSGRSTLFRAALLSDELAALDDPQFNEVMALVRSYLKGLATRGGDTSAIANYGRKLRDR